MTRPVRTLAVLCAIAFAGCGADGDPAATTSPPQTVTTTTSAGQAPATTTTSTAPPAGEAPTSTAMPALQGYDLEPVAAGLQQPVWAGAPAGEGRLYLVEQPGRVRVVTDGGLVDEPVLDITDRVGFGGERGLLGLAFHPDFDNNGRFFVDYTDADGSTVVAEFRMENGRVDADAERVLLRIAQPAANHNGGMVAFGPDGYLYVGMGDGGGANDRFGQGQRPDTLLGALLRIDVDGVQPYAVPADNPYSGGSGGEPEVWAIGLRNPWRFSFDGGMLYLGDVGQGNWEEIDVVPADRGGLNYGWPILEGSHCFQASGCDPAPYVLPVLEYSHAEGCSVTGGVVYRGAAIPELAGHYLYSDYCSGWVRSFRYADGEATEPNELFGSVGPITAFGVDGTGEVLVTVHTGEVLRLIAVR